MPKFFFCLIVNKLFFFSIIYIVVRIIDIGSNDC